MSKLIAAALIALSFAGPAQTASAGGIKNAVLADANVSRAIAAAVERERIVYGGKTPVPGVLIGVWDGAGGSYVHDFGYADLANKRALTAADHFRIGSNTKTFVVSVILQLVDEGKLSLDDSLDKFDIGVKVPNARNITVRELCEMRSGLFEAFDTPQMNRMNVKPETTFDPKTLIGWAVAQKPYFAPNAGYNYSNTNYLILGQIIEALTHDSVGDQIRKRLLIPFGLSQTSYPQTQAMPDPWAHGYGLDKNRNWEDVSGTIPVSLMGAAGEMISDMTDMRKWITLYVAGKASKPATHRALMNCVPTGHGNLAFGLGLGCSAGWYGYTGGLPGYNTADYYFPATGAFIVAWVDLQADKPSPGVANAIFRDIARIMTPGNVPFSGGDKGL
ncbi:MAG TPA: serine hydrolase domain-containing protein [Candidatus Baltobacteraceae bacterium]|jgi:D-alanyl-D-alanine carboxypeptidase